MLKIKTIQVPIFPIEVNFVSGDHDEFIDYLKSSATFYGFDESMVDEMLEEAGVKIRCDKRIEAELLCFVKFQNACTKAKDQRKQM